MTAGTNDFLPWAIGSGANVPTQSAYATSSILGTGAVNGVADPLTFNKAVRQATSMAAMLGQFMALPAQNVQDDGDIATLLSQFSYALSIFVGLSGYLPLTGGTLTGSLAGLSAAFTGNVSGGNLSTGGNLVVSGNVSTTGNISNSGSISSGGPIQIASASTVIGPNYASAGSMTVAGRGNFGGDLSAGGNLSTNGSLSIGTTVIQNGDFALSYSTDGNGHIHGNYTLPAGLILKFGLDNSALSTGGNAGAVITFADPFPARCFGIVAVNTVAGSANHINASVIDRTSFHLSNSDAAGSFTDTAFWIALGV